MSNLILGPLSVFVKMPLWKHVHGETTKKLYVALWTKGPRQIDV